MERSILKMKMSNIYEDLSGSVTYRCSLELSNGRRLTARATLSDDTQPLETVLRHDVHSSLCMRSALLEEGLEVGFEVLGRGKGDDKDTEELPALEHAFTTDDDQSYGQI